MNETAFEIRYTDESDTEGIHYGGFFGFPGPKTTQVTAEIRGIPEHSKILWGLSLPAARPLAIKPNLWVPRQTSRRRRDYEKWGDAYGNIGDKGLIFELAEFAVLTHFPMVTSVFRLLLFTYFI